MRERQTEPTDQEMKKLMGMKRIARGAMVVMILCLVLVFVALLLKNAGVDIADTAGVVLTVLLFAMALIYYHFHEKAKRQQAAMGVDRTPDEVAKEREKERKRVEEVNRLVSTPGAVDRRLARLARLYSFCEWNLRAGMVGMLLAIVVVLVHTFVIEISMSFIAVFAVVISIALVIGMIGSFWVQKQQKKLSLHYTPEVLEAVLDRLELYDHKGSVDHGYLWEDFSYPEREWVGPCADHVKGVLKGMPLEFSEFCFEYEHVSRDDDGKIKRETRTSFNGMMVVCRHGFRLKNKVTLTQFNLFRHALRTESMEFNSVWSIREDAGQDAFYILTPHYMEKLVALDQDKWMKMGIQFQPNGTLLIVMRDVDFFEAEESKSADELKEKLKNELLDLADTMERIGAATLEEIAAQQEEGEGAT